MYAVRSLLNGPSSAIVSVLGDSTGNSPREWPALWAQTIANSRRVDMHLWDRGLERYGSFVYRYGRRGPSLTIWNGSIPGASSQVIEERLSELMPVRPSFVVVSVGHDENTWDRGEGFRRLVESVLARLGSSVPVVALLQNAALEPAAARSKSNIANVKVQANAMCLPVVDVFTGFEQSDLASLITDDGDGVHPNDAGSRLWADIFASVMKGESRGPS
ncbi:MULTISPECIES: SGNH/GDSL hydrolase family protein [Gordonia]|uniref:SGNH/GDSL hydrolase family protein n=1 Tax=Gordonia TaxID=2053 RepID=UPI002FC714A6